MAQENNLRVDEKGFLKAFNKHQAISKKGAKKKFGGVGIKDLDSDEEIKKVTQLHTAVHLLHQSLRTVLGEEVRQRGSDINPERLRLDFSFGRKLTNEEKEKVENMVNKQIKLGLEVKREKMELSKAIKSGALAFFKEKYPDIVSVYSIFNPKTGEVFSKEICAGPHITNLKELGEFKIKKEKSSSQGIRRIKAVLK